MTADFSFHNPMGTGDFLGLRRNRTGTAEIVYDDGVARRMVWRVSDGLTDDQTLREALESAVAKTRVLPALFAELQARAIAIEAIAS